jgi:hypothetical protein
MASDDEKFREAVTLYVELNDEITQTMKELREVKKRKDALGNTILECMRTRDVDECQLPDGGRLVRKASKRTETLKKEHILDELKTTLGVDESKAEAVLNNIYSKRGLVIKETLSRTKK